MCTEMAQDGPGHAQGGSLAQGSPLEGPVEEA